jgi:hypothetical protein
LYYRENEHVSHGIVVDEQVGAWCTAIMKKLIDDTAIPGALLSIDEISYLGLIQTYLDLISHDFCIVRILEIVWNGLEVQSLAVQFPIFNRSMHVATKVDLVTRDKRGAETQMEMMDRKDNSWL